MIFGINPEGGLVGGLFLIGAVVVQVIVGKAVPGHAVPIITREDNPNVFWRQMVVQSVVGGILLVWALWHIHL